MPTHDASPACENAVVISNLEKRFGSFVAVDRLSLEVRRGEIFGFLGPNGAGKSTTIRMLCGILQPDGGTGSVAGLDINSQTEEIKNNIGYMSQKFSLYEDLTVQENLEFYAGIYRLDARFAEQRREWAIEMAGLRAQRHALTSTLSGGWKQRLSLGCSILHEPPIVFLDEPTSGVDPISRRRFWDLIYTLAGNGTTVFVTTHYMDEAEYCDRLALIYRGQMIALGTPEDLKADATNGLLFEIRCRHLLEAAERVKRQAGITDVAVFGNVLHLSAASHDTAQGALAMLQENGDADAVLERVIPTLEDVFISSIERYDHAHQPVREGTR